MKKIGGSKMKIKIKNASLEQALSKVAPKQKIKKPNFLFATLVRILSTFELISTRFSFNKQIRKSLKEPSLILMNHSCFLDLKIASKILYPKKYFIVCWEKLVNAQDWVCSNSKICFEFRFNFRYKLLSKALKDERFNVSRGRILF